MMFRSVIYQASCGICNAWFYLHLRVTSLALGQSYDCPNANEATPKDMQYIPWIY